MQNNDMKQLYLLNFLSKIDSQIMNHLRLDKILFARLNTALTVSLLDAIKSVFACILTNIFDISFVGNNSNLLLITYLHQRKDYEKNWNDFKRILPIFDEIEIKIDIKKRKLYPIKTIIKNLLFLNKLLKEFRCVKPLATRLYIISRLIIVLNIITEVNLSRKHWKEACVYFDGSVVINPLIQILNKNNVLTVTLMHGQAVFRGFNTDFVNQTILLNLTSKYIILPGNYSKKQFLLAGVEKNRLKVLGTLRNIKRIVTENTTCFSVFLDCPTMNNSYENNKLLLEYSEKLAINTGLKYKVKIHPSDRIDNYNNINLRYGNILDKTKTIDDTLENSSFSLLHISGIYLDNLAAGVKCFCFRDNITNNQLVEFELDQFSDFSELIFKVNLWRNMNNNIKYDYIKKLVDYYLDPDYAKQRHVSFIESFL